MTLVSATFVSAARRAHTLRACPSIALLLLCAALAGCHSHSRTTVTRTRTLSAPSERTSGLAASKADDSNWGSDASELAPEPAPAASDNDATSSITVDEEQEVGPDETAAETFADDLEPHGEWVTTTTYGRCWRPAGVAVAWRPYTAGHWVYTDCGWAWNSDEPWGAITYHYGWWTMEAGAWMWVPGRVWAPAWVAWRAGNGYVGWAPLSPPRARCTIAVLAAARIPAVHFNFVPAHRVLEHNVGTFVEHSSHNTTLITKTTTINNVTVVNNRVVNSGPSRNKVEQITGKQAEAAVIKPAGGAGNRPTLATPRTSTGGVAQGPSRPAHAAMPSAAPGTLSPRPTGDSKAGTSAGSVANKPAGSSSSVATAKPQASPQPTARNSPAVESPRASAPAHASTPAQPTHTAPPATPARTAPVPAPSAPPAPTRVAPSPAPSAPPAPVRIAPTPAPSAPPVRVAPAAPPTRTTGKMF